MSYIITKKTMAIIPDGSKSKIIENNNTLIINEKVNDIVSRSCNINGSTLEGRQKGSAYLIGSNYKPPIVINNEIIILIPTHSVRNPNCSWILLHHILNYYPHEDNNVLIEFRNHQKITLNISYGIFDRQVLRATRLESALRGRNRKKYL